MHSKRNLKPLVRIFPTPILIVQYFWHTVVCEITLMDSMPDTNLYLYENRFQESISNTRRNAAILVMITRMAENLQETCRQNSISTIT